MATAERESDTPRRKRGTRSVAQRGSQPDTADLLTVARAAAFLGITEKALRARIARREIPFRRWGSRIFFVPAELSEFVRELTGCTLGEASQNLTKRRR